MSGRELDDLREAYTERFPFHDENLLMLSWYAERLIGCLRREQAGSLLSLGIGHQVVTRALLGAGFPLQRYVIVEGSAAAIEALRAARELPPVVEVVHGFFEDFTPTGPVDAVEMGFVLEHVEDPALVLARFARFVRPGGRVVVVVPNARALHRVVGHEAGLLDDVHRLSAEDLRLGHRRYFDLTSLTRLVLDAGLRIVTVEGVFLKPLPTAQLQSLALPPHVLRAFCAVGVGYPEIANAIYVEAAR
jgi:SAM-dependent methyltransferase